MESFFLRILLFVFAMCIPLSLSAKTMQRIPVTGVVTDDTGEPMAGVNIVVKGTTIGTMSDTDGKYTVQAPDRDAVLVYSYIGYISQEITAGNNTTLNVVMNEDTQQIEEVVVVGYGVQRRTTITGAVASVKGADINMSPVSNVSNALAGRIPGLVTYQRSGEPGNDGTTLRIRGVNTFGDTSPLIVVDGVPGRSLDRIDANTVENITVLKDASAAIYGSRAANGVILVTTKRGAIGKPKIDLRLNQGVNQPSRIPEMCNSFEYATMMNELNEARGLAPRYTADELQKFKDGSDPWRYPDVDYFKETFKKWSVQNDYNLSLSGGTDRVNYFISLGTIFEDGYYKHSATYFKQYHFRSNLDAQVTRDIKVGLDIAGRMEDRNYPSTSLYNTFRMLMRGKPTDPGIWPNGLLGPDLEGGYNPMAISRTGETGYDRDKRYALNTNMKLEVKIPWVTGLSVTANASIDKGFRFRKLWQTPWYLYSWDRTSYDANGDPVMIKGKKGYDDPRLQEWMEDNITILLNGIINYETRIERHGIRLIAGSERIEGKGDNFNAYRRYFPSTAVDQLFAGSDLERNGTGSGYENARMNYFGRVNYNFAERLLFEFVWRYDGSYIFPKAGRMGFFPGVSAGWRISEENFWKKHLSFIDRFKLRASWGQTGNDRISEWQYLATYSMPGDTYIFGETLENKLLREARIPNRDVTWEVATQSDGGFEGAVMNGKLYFEFDYFYNKRNNILWNRNASVPTSSGLTLPRENIGKVRNRGVDFIVGYQNNSGKFRYSVSINGSYARNKILFWDEAPGAPEWKQSTGKQIDASVYYESIGIFNTQADLDNNAKWQNARLGDVIFRDVDGDGRISADDQVRNDKSNYPRFTSGLNINLYYGQFDLNILFNAATGAVYYLQTESGDIGNFLKEYYDERWYPGRTDATGPRVNINTAEYWISQGNTKFLRNTDYIKLRNFEFGYTLPKYLSQKLGVSNLRIYASGNNVLIFCPGLKDFDPEMNEGGGRGYSVPRVLNIGVNLSF